MHTHCRTAADTEALAGRMARTLSIPPAAPLVLYLIGELGALRRSHGVEEEPYSNFSNIHDSK